MAGLINGIGSRQAAGIRVPIMADAEAPDLSTTDLYQTIKFRVFDLVLEHIEQRGITIGPQTTQLVADEIALSLSTVTAKEGVAFNTAEREVIVQDVQNEITGFGPLQPLLADETIDDVIVNGPHRVYIERAGKLSRVPVRFRDDNHLMNIVQRIVSPTGRRVDEASPFVDARLPDGSRVNIIVPPVAIDGAMLSIRKFRPQSMKPNDYVSMGSLTRDMLDFLATAVRSRLNILICGGTGSGKTTMLNMLSGFIGQAERLITIEDAAELQLRQSHVVRLETRPPNADGTREVGARDLLRNALRMRPDRIILGEVRGGEAVEMMQAMNTGHDGSMATLHANSSRDAFGRLELLLGFGGLSGDSAVVRRYIANSINVLVQVQRMGNGKRRITSVAELTGIEGESYSLNQLFKFEEKPPLSGEGEFVTGSRRPFFSDRLVTRIDTRSVGGA
jgi:pilus assembly protein CpaF